MAIGCERSVEFAHQAVVVAHLFERVAHLGAVGRTGKVDGSRQDVRQVVGVAEADRAGDLFGPRNTTELAGGVQHSAHFLRVRTEQAEALDHRKIEPGQGVGTHQLEEAAAGQALVRDDGNAQLGVQRRDLTQQADTFLVADHHQNGLRSAVDQPGVLLQQRFVAEVVPLDADDLRLGHLGQVPFCSLPVAAPPAGVGQHQAQPGPTDGARPIDHRRHRDQIVQRQAERVAGLEPVIDDVACTRPRREQHDLHFMGRLDHLGHHRAETPAEHRNHVGHRRQLGQVGDAARRIDVVVLGDEFERPTAQHAAGAVDLVHRDADAEFDGLRRGAVDDRELSVQADPHRCARRWRSVCAGQTQHRGQTSDEGCESLRHRASPVAIAQGCVVHSCDALTRRPLGLNRSDCASHVLRRGLPQG